ncbi:hypothetical protein BT63DRAFT_219691 [Microthyrium microscopicum]|uniref:Uncharacterized protein n=1 Tax=Microthyrium microscopicum TaxID=703497 RepID=A0A6A6UGW4_9PEZI|nr:hypothetical protein BT63DRAFT_219691 [Microthyrium microscopicum]
MAIQGHIRFDNRRAFLAQPARQSISFTQSYYHQPRLPIAYFSQTWADEVATTGPSELPDDYDAAADDTYMNETYVNTGTADETLLQGSPPGHIINLLGLPLSENVPLTMPIPEQTPAPLDIINRVGLKVNLDLQQTPDLERNELQLSVDHTQSDNSIEATTRSRQTHHLKSFAFCFFISIILVIAQSYTVAHSAYIRISHPTTVCNQSLATTLDFIQDLLHIVAPVALLITVVGQGRNGAMYHSFGKHWCSLAVMLVSLSLSMLVAIVLQAKRIKEIAMFFVGVSNIIITLATCSYILFVLRHWTSIEEPS